MTTLKPHELAFLRSYLEARKSYPDACIALDWITDNENDDKVWAAWYVLNDIAEKHARIIYIDNKPQHGGTVKGILPYMTVRMVEHYLARMTPAPRPDGIHHKSWTAMCEREKYKIEFMGHGLLKLVINALQGVRSEC